MFQRFGKLSRTARHIGRYRQIVTVLVRYGFGQVFQQLRIERYLRLGRRALHVEPSRAAGRSRAERIRLALEELGPTFVKLGQLLSTRPDLVPLDIVQELVKLQESAPPFDGDEARRIVEKELGRPIEQVFRTFDTEPIAAASLGQVHTAVLAADGSEVAVKVQRPRIEDTVETDLEILEDLSRLVERGVEALELQRPSAIVDEFKRALEKELDYTIEAAHLRRFARMFEDSETVRVPRVYREWTTRRVLVMERLSGSKVSDRSRLVAEGFDPQQLARNGTEAVLSQIFLHGFFHSDPHPGNVLALTGNVVGFIDLGQVGRLDRRTRYLTAQLLQAMVERDEESVTDTFLELTVSEEPPDRHLIEADVAEVLDWYMDRPLGELQIGRMVVRLMEIAAGHELRISPGLFLVFKALGTLESLAQTLDPEFDISASARPVLERLARERLSPRRLAAETWVSTLDMARLLRDIPGELRQIMDKLRRGRLRVEFEHQGLEPALHTHELATNRLTFGIVLAAILIASSLLALGDIPPKWRGLPILGILGYLLSGVLGLGLLWSIIRHGRL